MVREAAPTLPTEDTKPSPCSTTLCGGIKLSNQSSKKTCTQEGETGWEGGKRERGQAPDHRNSNREGEQTPGSIVQSSKNKTKQKPHTHTHTKKQHNSPPPASTSKLLLRRSYEKGIKKTP